MDGEMHYEVEELVPIVGRLAREYTGGESTSVTYEKAEQLMGAVLYCIREAEGAGGEEGALAGRMSAVQAYEAGLSRVKEKVKAALALYHGILPEFDSYGNRCLEDTFLKGMPEFFKWYDVKFEPQNTIVTLDYPVLKDLSGDAGVDRIFGFLRCLRLEQRFLRRFPKEFVQKALDGAGAGRNGAAENLCGIVLETALKRLLGEGDAAAYLALAMEDAVVRLNYAGLKDTADNG